MHPLDFLAVAAIFAAPVLWMAEGIASVVRKMRG